MLRLFTMSYYMDDIPSVMILKVMTVVILVWRPTVFSRHQSFCGPVFANFLWNAIPNYLWKIQIFADFFPKRYFPKYLKENVSLHLGSDTWEDNDWCFQSHQLRSSMYFPWHYTTNSVDKTVDVSFCSSAKMVSMVCINAYCGIFEVWTTKIGSYEHF